MYKIYCGYVTYLLYMLCFNKGLIRKKKKKKNKLTLLAMGPLHCQSFTVKTRPRMDTILHGLIDYKYTRLVWGFSKCYFENLPTFRRAKLTLHFELLTKTHFITV